MNFLKLALLLHRREHSPHAEGHGAFTLGSWTRGDTCWCLSFCDHILESSQKSLQLTAPCPLWLELNLLSLEKQTNFISGIVHKASFLTQCRRRLRLAHSLASCASCGLSRRLSKLQFATSHNHLPIGWLCRLKELLYVEGASASDLYLLLFSVKHLGDWWS